MHWDLDLADPRLNKINRIELRKWLRPRDLLFIKIQSTNFGQRGKNGAWSVW